MIFLLVCIPLIISVLIGLLLIRWILGKGQDIDPLLLFFIAAGLGLGISAALTFFSFILLNQFNRPFIITIHLAVLAGLTAKQILDCRREKKPFIVIKPLNKQNLIIIAVLVAALWPLYLYASYYPYGGWDAWSCWNLKARFLYLGKEDWQNMFDPVLWRASPHYPLLLPLLHVWSWCFLPAPVEAGPMINSLLFTVLTAGLLISGLKSFIPLRMSVLSGLLMLTLPFYVKLAISQYSDIVLGYFVLAAMICLIQTKIEKKEAFVSLAGIFLGFLSFTKPEGLMAALILIVLAIPYFLWKEKQSAQTNRLIGKFFLSAAIAFIPTILFQILYSPGNQTFINGLTSTDKPADTFRFQFIFAYLYSELKSEKWHYLWGFLAIGMMLGGRQSFRRETLIIPVFLLTYSGIIMVYYFLNTYFEIAWWMTVTLNRILFSLLPTALFGIFYTLWRQEQSTGPE